MFRKTMNICFLAALAMLLVPAHAFSSGACAKVTYKDGGGESLKLNREPSDIRRFMFDTDKAGDRMVITYWDDTHQVFKLKKKASDIKRLVFEDGKRGPGMTSAPLKEAYSADARQAPVTAGTGLVQIGQEDIGNIWKVKEKCGGSEWKSTWVRRGSSHIFDATWEGAGGIKKAGVLEYEGIDHNRIKIYRPDMNGYYEGTLSEDRNRIINGWASWYQPNCLPWFAAIE